MASLMGSLWVFSHTDEFSFKFIKFFLIMSYSFQIYLKGQRPSSQKFLFLGLKKRLSWRKVLILSFSHSFFRVPFKKSKIFLFWLSLRQRLNKAQSFYIHMETHCGEKSNKCSHSKSASSHTTALRIHMKTHNGEKLNKCNQCSYISSQ